MKRPRVIKQPELNGLFIVDLKALQLSDDQLSIIGLALQTTVQTELAKLDDAEGVIGSPLGGGITGFIASIP